MKRDLPSLCFPPSFLRVRDPVAMLSVVSFVSFSADQVFNSRATQLVLGAGAIHSAAKLKSISTRHLALCSQSLGLVRSLVPHLKAALATRLPQKYHLLLEQMDSVSQVSLRVSWAFL